MLPCYDCKHRKSIPGDAHSRCEAWKRADTSEILRESNPHGIKMGWFLFPHNFDPVWGPDECQKFEAKGD